MRNLGRLMRLWRREFWVNLVKNSRFFVNFWRNLGENSRQMLNFYENSRKFQRNSRNLNATLPNFKANSWQSVDCHDFACLHSQSLAMTRYHDFCATYGLPRGFFKTARNDEFKREISQFSYQISPKKFNPKFTPKRRPKR